MATTKQLSALFRSISDGDLSRAASIAAEIADSTEKQGHRPAAQALRGSLNPNGRAGAEKNQHRPAIASTLGLLIEEQSESGLGDVRLRAEARAELEDVILEFRHKAELSSQNSSRRQTILFTGPPGCGKSMTARALGREIGIPTYTARLSAIVGSYLGQTGAHLHQLFTWAEAQGVVLLLDEIDALGQSRGRSEDVGELDRVVISLLHELDHTRPAGLTIAATNRPESLDDALLRRFDLCLDFPLPSKKELASFSRDRAKEFGVRLDSSDRASLASTKTYAEVDTALQSIRRRRVLSDLRREE